MPDIKIAYGIVRKNGRKLIGDGFSSRRIKTGMYEIKYSSDFRKVPAVTVTTEHEPDSPRKVLNAVIDKEDSNDVRRDRVVVMIQTPNGEANDNRFQFIAIAED